MAQDPEAIRGEIERTRERMGDTVDALAYKADVPSRVRETVAEKKDAVVDTVGRTKDAVIGKISEGKDAIADTTGQLAKTVGDKAPDTGDAKRSARRAASVAQENPLGLALGAAAVGFLAGTLIPSTPLENEKLGPVADEVKRQAADTGQEAVERGKQVVQEAAASAVGTARERGQQQAQELSGRAAKSAKKVASRAAPSSGS